MDSRWIAAKEMAAARYRKWRELTKTHTIRLIALRDGVAQRLGNEKRGTSLSVVEKVPMK